MKTVIVPELRSSDILAAVRCIAMGYPCECSVNHSDDSAIIYVADSRNWVNIYFNDEGSTVIEWQGFADGMDTFLRSLDYAH